MSEEFQIILLSNEVNLMVNAINTAKEFLQDQKGNIAGAMMGFTKIDSLCDELDSIKDKLINTKAME